MTVKTRDSVATVGAGSSVAAGIPTRSAGDLLFAVVGGGNQVTSYSAGWTSVQHTTGVEAQGELLWRTATNTSADNLTLNFDGGDPYRVVVDSKYSTAGHSLLWQIASTSRQGTTSGILPAVSFTAPVTGNAGNLVNTYIFLRNGATVPTVAPGALVHSATTAGHSFGYWEDTKPQNSASIAIDLPVRTGHFRASVRFFEWEWTDWQTDSVPFNASTVAYVNPATADGSVSRQGGADRNYDVAGSSSANQHDATTGVWAATGDATDGSTMPPRFRVLVRNTAIIGETLVSRAQYAVYWLTAARTTPPEATSGILPDTVYDPDVFDYADPLVFGEEWEPTSTPKHNELAVRVRDVGGSDANLVRHVGRPLHVKLVTGLASGEVYDPDSMSANALASLSDWHTLDVPLTWVDGDTVEGAWTDHGMPLVDEGGRFAVAIVDDFTQTNTFPPTYTGPAPGPGEEAEGSTVYWAYEVLLNAYMAPRYRLKREVVGVLSVVRQYPRDDTLGHGATVRTYPPPRGARRTVGGQP